jgi:flavin-dependent dehydrogenase
MLGGQLAGEAAADYVTGMGTERLDEYQDEIEATIADSMRHASGRRREMLDSWRDEDDDFSRALRRSWIAFPEYSGQA